jgi:hypothetical protein
MKSRNKKPCKLVIQPYCSQDADLSLISEEISRHGRFLQRGEIHLRQGIQVDFPFIYTIGNSQLGLPELLMIGSHDAEAFHELNQMCETMRKNNRPFEEGELIDLRRKFPLKSVNAGDEAKEYTVFVEKYYGTNDYAVQQILLPDVWGLYPDDPQCRWPACLAPVLKRRH